MDPDTLVSMMSQLGINPNDLAAMMGQPNAGNTNILDDIMRTAVARMGLSPDGSTLGNTETIGPSREGPPSVLHRGATLGTVERYKAWFEEERTRAPCPAPIIPRSLLIEGLRQTRQEHEQLERSTLADGIQTRMTILGFAKHSSKVSLERLKPITFAEMLLRKTHTGHYLLCRTITPCGELSISTFTALQGPTDTAARVSAVHTIVEDVNGSANLLAIYNFPGTSDGVLKYLDLLFPVGVTLAILEPTFKPAMQGPNPMIRVDSPTDIVFLSPQHEVVRNFKWKTGAQVSRLSAWPHNADRWKVRGNDHFKAGYWLPAAFAYSCGLEYDPDSLVLRSNRAEAYLRLKFYSAASADAHYVRSADGAGVESLRDKALFREAKAEYGRGKYQHAKTLFERLRLTQPDDREVANWISRCNQRIVESSEGTYDWTSLFKQSQVDPWLDIADYQGPIEVKQMPNRGGGRGVATTTDVHVGDLLLVSKPFSCATNEVQRSPTLQMTLNMITSRMDKRSQSANVSYAAQAIYGNPDLHDHVFHLYAGPQYPPPPSTYPPVVAGEPVVISPLSPTVRVDIAQLESICTHNNFGPTPLRPGGYAKISGSPEDSAMEWPTALYLLPSLFNHSCMPNVHYHFIGNVMMIRASQTIKAGEEATLAYCSPMTPYAERRTMLRDGWNMSEECDCRQCQDDRADGEQNLKRRESILSGLPSDLFRRPLAELRSLQRQLSATYAVERGPVRPDLHLIHHSIAESLRFSKNRTRCEQAIEENVKSLTCLGWVVEDGKGPYGARSKRREQHLAIKPTHVSLVSDEMMSISAMLRIAQTYLSLDDMVNARKWVKTAQWVINTCIGGEKELFMLVVKPRLEQFELHEFARSVLWDS